MGVPKFYRWISERYPTLSEVVRDHQIPDFDNLYLDMNGIIHTCSHPNDADPHFRITEEQIFKDIFHYIEALFCMIRPKKVFFMAVDGVAPRAKMNQQRGRRFRSAREAEESESRARAKGEVLPSEERFDSNCITPGTEFMDRLDKQLQYFVTSKVSTDSAWQSCTIIYSGHQTPGEGEHKIMEYIRYQRSQPGYDPDTRHCLYGLDADLIMLGLTSHDPHFSLLREEVKFGGRKEASKRTTTAEETTFHLLHLSLLREYINYEFEEIADKLSFKYDLERIIDDWVFMGFLVGNDFIPHLPTLHINKDALPLLFSTYKSVMPDLDGYLNEGGVLNLARFEKFMAKLADYDRENFSDLNADLQYFNSKRSGQCKDIRLRDQLENFYDDGELDGEDDMGGLLSGLSGASLHDSKKKETTSETLRRLGIQDPLSLSEDEEDDDDDDDDEDEEFDSLAEEFRQHKRNYYMEKMGYEDHEKFADICHEQAINYVRGLQWILHYYYNGIQSWSWYYPFHYAPYISDIKNFANTPMEFDLSKPFMPFEQLLAVLPPLSVKLLPKCYAQLMLSQDSPVIDFYPRTFETDLNGKQQDWEAVVLIPFIDEKRLLEAMSAESHRLTADEQRRTAHGPMYVYTYTPDNLGTYQSPQYFPNVCMNHAKLELVFRDEWDIPKEKIRKGLCPGARTDLYFSGFPTLRHLQHTYRLEKASVKVFQQPSRNDSIVLELQNRFACPQPSRQWFEEVARKISSKIVFVGWPHLKEAQVVGVSSSDHRVSVQTSPEGEIVLGEVEDVSENEQKRSSYGSFGATTKALSSLLFNRWGIDAGDTTLVLHCRPMTGKRYVMNPCGKLTLNYDWSEHTQTYLAQTVVQDIVVHDPGHPKTCSLEEHFPVGSKVFMLGQPHYGACGTVLEGLKDQKGPSKTRIRVQIESRREPDLTLLKATAQRQGKYMDAYMVGQRLGVSQQLVVRITGSVLMVPSRDPSKPCPAPDDFKSKVNIGLNLRINKKMEEVRGYSHRAEDVWMYSEATLELLQAYHSKFPRVIEVVSKTRNDVTQQELFPGPDGNEELKALLDWLKESEVARNVRQAWGTELLSNETVAKLKYEIDNSTKLQLSQPVKMQVKPHLLFKPNPLQGSTPVDGPVKTELWDRIVNVRDGYMVPLAARGTVIGIQPAAERADVLYDILFDEPFAGGLTLAGAASAKCCYRLCASAFINLSAKTRPQPLSGSAINLAPTKRRGPAQPDPYSRPREQDQYQRSWSSAAQSDFRTNNVNNNFSGDRKQPAPNNSIFFGGGQPSSYSRYMAGSAQPSNTTAGNFRECKQFSNDSGFSKNWIANTKTVNDSLTGVLGSRTQGYGNRPSFGSNTNENRPIQSDTAVPVKEKEALEIIKRNDPINLQSNEPSSLSKASNCREDIAVGTPGPASGYPRAVKEELESQQPPDAAELPSPSFFTRNKVSNEENAGEILMRALQSPQKGTQSRKGSSQAPTPKRSEGREHHTFSQNEARTSNYNQVPQQEPKNLPMQVQQQFRPQHSHQQHSNHHKPSHQQMQHQQRHSQQQQLLPNPQMRSQHNQLGTPYPGQYWPGGYQGGGGVPASRGGVIEVTHPGQVECIVYGTYFNRWSVIRQYGINRGSSQHFPCLAYDPLTSAKARPSDRGFEIIIYFDVAECLAEGVKFLVLPAGQVLCSGNANGKVPPQLFDRVLDVAKNQIIYPQASNRLGSTSNHSWVAPSSVSVSPFMPTQVIKKGVAKGKRSEVRNPHVKEPKTPLGSSLPMNSPSQLAHQRTDQPDEREGQELSNNASNCSYKKPTRRLACNFKK